MASSLGLSSPLLGETRKFQGPPLFSLLCELQRHLEGQRPTTLFRGPAFTMPLPATHLYTPTRRLSLHGGALSFRDPHRPGFEDQLLPLVTLGLQLGLWSSLGLSIR